MRTQPVPDRFSGSPLFAAVDRPLSVWFPEAQFLIVCAHTSVGDRARLRIREAAQGSIDWPLVFDLARYHGVGPLLYRTISAVCADLVPKESLDALRQLTQAGTLLNHVMAQELVQLCRAFSENGVPVAPFKGATLAAMAYDDLTLRDFDDLDFIVPQHRLVAAQRVLWAQGYRPRDRSPEEADSAHADEPYHVFVKKNSLMRVDLQWVMAHDQFAFRLDRREVWDHRVSLQINGDRVESVAPEELLILLCVHGSKHAWERLKWVVDVAELVRAQKLNWKRVHSTATRWKCRRLLFMGLALARQLMDVALPPAIADKVSVDPDVSLLVQRMPKSLLAQRHGGIDEHDGPALYFSLKDTWWDRWQYGLSLCRHRHPTICNPPSWFRWRRSLALLSHTLDRLHTAANTCYPIRHVWHAVRRFCEPAH
jgi:Uncharacterised nucleotidyltransferase